MAYSYVDYSGNGVLTQFAVPFPYLDKAHIVLTVGGNVAPFTWLDDSTIIASVPPVTGVNNVRIKRVTPIVVPRITFVDGATVTQDQLNQQSKQEVYALQEQIDFQTGGVYTNFAIPVDGSVSQVKLASDVQYQVSTISALKALTVKYTTVLVHGYTAAGDGGGGIFLWNAADSSSDDGGLVIQPNSGGTGRWNRVFFGEIDVRWFGLKGDNSTANSTRLQALFNCAKITANSAMSIGTGVYFPAGKYLLDSAVSSVGKIISLRGDGPDCSVLIPNFIAGDAVTIDLTGVGNQTCSMANLGFGVSVNRNVDAYCIVYKACGTLWISNCNITSSGANGSNSLKVLDTNTVIMNGVQCYSFGGTAFRLDGSSIGTGAQISACTFRKGSLGFISKGPAFLLQGTTTSLTMTGCDFAGGGPKEYFTPSSITSTVSNFTINGLTGHGFVQYDTIIIAGATPSAYNGAWSIASVTATSVTVTSAINPGTASVVGKIYSRPCSLQLDASSGAINEGTISSCVIETNDLIDKTTGTCSVFLRAISGEGSISGYSLANNYYDYGSTSVVAHSKLNSYSNNTIGGLCISQSRCVYTYSCIELIGAGATIISDLSGEGQPVNNPTLFADSRFILISSDTSKTNAIPRYIKFANCDLGGTRQSNDSVPDRIPKYGIYIEGTNPDLIKIGNSDIYGTTAPLFCTGSLSAIRIKSKNNNWFTGVPPYSVPNVASASTITLPPNEVVRITGSTTISTINGGWSGREVMLIFDVASTCTIATGGNVLQSSAASPGRTSSLYFDGTNWYIR